MTERDWELAKENDYLRDLDEFDAKQDAIEAEVVLMNDWSVYELINEAYGAGLGPTLDNLLGELAQALMKGRAEEGDL